MIMKLDRKWERLDKEIVLAVNVKNENQRTWWETSRNDHYWQVGTTTSFVGQKTEWLIIARINVSELPFQIVDPLNRNT